MVCCGDPVPTTTALNVSLAFGQLFGAERNVQGTMWEISPTSASYLDNPSSEWLRPVAWNGVRGSRAEWEGTLGCVLALLLEAV